MNDYKISIPDDLATKVGLATARKLFDARGNPSEMHLAESEIAVVIASTIEVTFKLVSIKEVA